MYSPILYARRPCRLIEPGKLRLGCNRFELTFLESFESFMFLRINLRRQITFAQIVSYRLAAWHDGFEGKAVSLLYDQRRAPYDHPDFSSNALSEDLFSVSLASFLHP
jgi:hypothetical protein